ncbi:MAG: hypothetical protein ACREEO_00745 [Phenylobacterium sp.]
MKIPLYDFAAVAGFFILLVGLVTFAGLGREVPAYLVDAFKVSIGVVLRSGVAIGNEYRHPRLKP